MFKKIKQFFADIKALKEEVYGRPQEESALARIKRFHQTFAESLYGGFVPKTTLKERVDGLQVELEKSRARTQMILDHFGLEYVKITEENGNRRVVEKLRKKKKTAKGRYAQRKKP